MLRYAGRRYGVDSVRKFYTRNITKNAAACAVVQNSTTGFSHRNQGFLNSNKNNNTFLALKSHFCSDSSEKNFDQPPWWAGNTEDDDDDKNSLNTLRRKIKAQERRYMSSGSGNGGDDDDDFSDDEDNSDEDSDEDSGEDSDSEDDVQELLQATVVVGDRDSSMSLEDAVGGDSLMGMGGGGTQMVSIDDVPLHKEVFVLKIKPGERPPMPLKMFPQVITLTEDSYQFVREHRNLDYAGVFMMDEAKDDVPGSMRKMGVYCKILNMNLFPSHGQSATPGLHRVMVFATHRVEISNTKPGNRAEINHLTLRKGHESESLLHDKDGTEKHILKAYRAELEKRMWTIAQHLGQESVVLSKLGSFGDSDYADMAAFVLAFTGVGGGYPDKSKTDDRTVSCIDYQDVLETTRLQDRMDLVLTIADKVDKALKLQKEIQNKTMKEMTEMNRKHMLEQQLKMIKKELNVDDDKDAIISKYEKRVKAILGDDYETKYSDTNELTPEEEAARAEEEAQSTSLMSLEAKRVLREEMVKLKLLEKHSPEFNVTRNYLDWLTSLPYDTLTEENFDLTAAQDILEEDHYGLSDIKERILEFIAVGKLRGTVQGKIICFVGPPGVGKTSIGKSIARALNREFFRFSVGGLSDVAEIKGHRRTYVGAMPGKLIQGLKQTGSSNPLVLIDEIDKLGRGHQGDPASALLELLDPGQNSAFTDHYMDVPVDLSKVLFICTANVLDTIPGPLLDRLEVLRLSGYDLPEKVAIARRYLEPRAKKEAGLDSDGAKDGEDGTSTTSAVVEITEPAIENLARWYARESGVRTLQQYVERVYRKVALKVVKNEQSGEENNKWIISEDNLEDYAGKPKFTSDRLFETTPPGVVMGLAWTGMGGSALYIETSAIAKTKPATSESSDSKNKNMMGGPVALKITGKLGEVMQESVSISMTNARRVVQGIDPTNRFFDENEVFLHVPEGATPKDGPSAGCAMTIAFVSLSTGKPVRQDLAMTGEISLTGKVLPVGGIREKVIAARRSGVNCIILPKANEHDFDELQDYLKDGLEVNFADHFDQVMEVAFDKN